MLNLPLSSFFLNIFCLFLDVFESLQKAPVWSQRLEGARGTLREAWRGCLFGSIWGLSLRAGDVIFFDFSFGPLKANPRVWTVPAD